MDYVKNAFQVAPWVALSIFLGWYAQPPPKREGGDDENFNGSQDQERRMISESPEMMMSMGGGGGDRGSFDGSNVNLKDKRALERFLAEADSRANQAKEQENFEEALKLLEYMVSAFERSGFQNAAGVTVGHLLLQQGALQLQLHMNAEAKKSLTRSLEILKPIETKAIVALVLMKLGQIECAMRLYDDAYKHLDSAQDLIYALLKDGNDSRDFQSDVQRIAAQVLIEKTRVMMHQKRFSGAVAMIDEALNKIQEPLGVTRMLEQICALNFHYLPLPNANKVSEIVLSDVERVNAKERPYLVGVFAAMLAEQNLLFENYETSQKWYLHALSHFTSSELPVDTVESLLNTLFALSTLALRNGDTNVCEKYHSQLKNRLEESRGSLRCPLAFSPYIRVVSARIVRVAFGETMFQYKLEFEYTDIRLGRVHPQNGYFVEARFRDPKNPETPMLVSKHLIPSVAKQEFLYSIESPEFSSTASMEYMDVQITVWADSRKQTPLFMMPQLCRLFRPAFEIPQQAPHLFQTQPGGSSSQILLPEDSMN